MCSNYKGRRGTCEGTHYVRADSLEQIVMLELRRMALLLKNDEDLFVSILEAKTNKNMLKQQKFLEDTINKSIARSNEVAMMYERLFEEHIKGTVSDEWFMQLSVKYEKERDELKLKIKKSKDELKNLVLEARKGVATNYLTSFSSSERRQISA